MPNYYITSLFICQEVFQKFFQLFFVILSGCFLSESDPPIISHLFSFVKRFLKSFSTFFAIFSGLLYTVRRPLSRLLRAPLVQCSHIIALLPPIVKGFFSTFFTSVLSALCHNFVVESLCKKHMSCPLLARTHGFWGIITTRQTGGLHKG